MIRRRYDGPLDGAMGRLQQRVVSCRACPRLVEYRERKATSERRASFRDWDYWGAAVPSHGDPAECADSPWNVYSTATRPFPLPSPQLTPILLPT